MNYKWIIRFSFSSNNKQKKIKPQQIGKFVDAAKFGNDPESLLEVYNSKNEGRSIKLMNLVYLGIIGYNAYNYYDSIIRSSNLEDGRNIFNQKSFSELSISSYKSSRENSFLILVIVSVGMGLFFWKTQNTLKRMWLDSNGRDVYSEYYRWFGFDSIVRQMDNQSFRGFGYYGHPSLKIPIFKYGNGLFQDDRYKQGERVKSYFFKYSYVKEQQIMQDILLARVLQVKPKEMQMDISEAQRKKYGL